MDNRSLEARPWHTEESRKERAFRERIFAQSTCLPPFPKQDSKEACGTFQMSNSLVRRKDKDVLKRLKVPEPVVWNQRGGS